MRVEIVIYFYGIVCISMILFNVAYALLLKGSEPRMQRRQRKYRENAEIQLRHICRGEKIDEVYLHDLHKKLRHIKNLIAFDRMLQELSSENSGEEKSRTVRDYIIQLQPCILQLAGFYQNKENTQAAYFSFFLSRHILPEHLSARNLQEVMLGYMEKDNLYCSVNVLKALCTFGNEKDIILALKIQDQNSVFFHEKILTETLLDYQGDHSRLITLIWENLRKFTPRTQLALLNYIRFQSGDYTREMLSLLKENEADKEVILAAIRYFGRYRYPPAFDLLLEFAEDDDPVRWEYVTVSVSSLAAYRDPRTIEVLKKALCSVNWYVRCAAAASLEAQHVSDADLTDIIDGDDRYAREIMQYQLESGNLQREGDAKWK